MFSPDRERRNAEWVKISMRIPRLAGRFDRASELLGFSMPELCFEENDRLDITEYTQAAMVTASIAMMEVLKARGVKPDVAAGLSLGEYCALVAAGVMSADDAISTVRQRGIIM